MRAYLALGSNLGDRLSHLRDAVARLAAHDGLELVACSRIYETAPLGPPQGRYFNAAVVVETSLEPGELLEVCREVEDAGGRQRGMRWGPRTIDVDILDAGGMVVKRGDLELPHPEIVNRTFVLAPLKDVAPGWCHPLTDATASQMLAELGEPQPEELVPVFEPWEWCSPGTGHGPRDKEPA